MDGGLDHVSGVLGADDHVAELTRARGRPDAVDREREHVGGQVAPAMLAVEPADPVGVDELDREMAVGDPGGRERRLDRGSQVGRDVGEVECQSDFWRSEYAP